MFNFNYYNYNNNSLIQILMEIASTNNNTPWGDNKSTSEDEEPVVKHWHILTYYANIVDYSRYLLVI